MSRPFRPRPLDIHKKLPIVKSLKDLDYDEVSAVSRTNLHGNANAIGNSDFEPVQSTATNRRVGEIPTPQFVIVDSYEKDYARTFVQPSTYVRGRASRSEEFVEYDLDGEDEDWLHQLNSERATLSPESFEWLLYKMELFDHKARERAGGMPSMLGLPVPLLLQQEAALEVLRSQILRPAVLSAVYNYWKAKRERWRKPILRCLQPPPPVNDTNPFNVFRPREKIHRPHTRRRRENDVQSFDKLRKVRCHLEQARELLRLLQKREEKKRDLVDCEANLQRIQITLKHDSQLDDEVVMGANSAILTPILRKTGPFKRDFGHGILNCSNSSVVIPGLVNGHSQMHPACELTPPSSDGVVLLDHGDQPRRKGKRRMHQPRGRSLKRIAAVDTLEPVLLFTKPVDPEKLAAAGIVAPSDPSWANGLIQASPPYCFQGRIGRGGRVLFDRWNPLTRTPIGCSNLPVFCRSSLNRFHPPPPRLSLEKVNLVIPDSATGDRNLAMRRGGLCDINSGVTIDS